MSHFVTAWRDHTGNVGISVHICSPIGWDNVVTEELLIGPEAEAFVARCQEAWTRARGFTETAFEPEPGPYDDGWL